MERSYRIISNIPKLPTELPSGAKIQHTYLPIDDRPLYVAAQIQLASYSHDAVLLQYPPYAKLQLLLALRSLPTPLKRCKLIIFDLILRPPSNAKEKVRTEVYKRLLKQVDTFLTLTKDNRGFEIYYDIPPEKNSYVPFKVNDIEMLAGMAKLEGDYIWTGGRSHRDYDTFTKAVGATGYPTVILTPQVDEQRLHGSNFAGNTLPDNIRLVHDDGTNVSWNQSIADAKLVVMPINKGTLQAAGVSAYLVAMALKKCVIHTECPAVTDILDNEVNAIIVPAADPGAMEAAIRKAWEDDAYRERIAMAGYEYAMSLGGEEQLMQRIAEGAVAAIGV